jgi:hypothetical protein
LPKFHNLPETGKVAKSNSSIKGNLQGLVRNGSSSGQSHSLITTLEQELLFRILAVGQQVRKGSSKDT